MSTIVIKLEVSKASMLQSISFISPAPVFAAVMAMHALEMNLKQHRIHLGVKGVGMVHHDYKPWAEFINGLDHLNQRRSDCQFCGNKKSPDKASIQPVALMDMDWSLVVDCEHSVTQKDSITRAIEKMRLAGGQIKKTQVTIFDELNEAMNSVRSGFWIDDVTRHSQNERDPAQSLIETSQSKPWVIPANLGYALLTKPQERSGSRDGKPHAFVENMIGMVQFTPIGKAKEQGIDASRMWKYGWVENQFLVTNDQTNTLKPEMKMNQLQ